MNKKLTNEKWLNLYKTDAGWIFASRRHDQNIGTANVVDAVLIVPILLPRNSREHKKLVVIKEFRQPINSYEYHFPAGLLGANETIERSIERELLEETGYKLAKIKLISGVLTTSAGMTDETAVMAFVECVRGGKQQLEASEDIQVSLMGSRDINKLLKDKSVIISAKAWPVLLLFNAIGGVDINVVRGSYDAK